jgi:predicted SprT family Zn-dependent metalloprotease
MYDTKTPTATTYQALQDAYDWLNRELFNSELPQCIIVLHRKRNASGYFWSSMWQSTSDSASSLDEISLTPDTLDRGDETVLSTLAHEMVHLWQSHYGKPSRNAYHNKEWSAKMHEIGLQPISVPEGKETGQKCTHSIKPNDRFQTSIQRFLADRKVINWYGHTPNPKTAKKSKVVYECSCGNKVWGKAGLTIICKDCEEAYIEGS